MIPKINVGGGWLGLEPSIPLGKKPPSAFTASGLCISARYTLCTLFAHEEKESIKEITKVNIFKKHP